MKITGLGFVTPAGVGKPEFKAGIQEVKSRVGVVNRFPSNAGPFVAAEVQDFDIRKYYSQPNFQRLPRHTQFALAAAKFALLDSKVAIGDLQKLAPLVITGTSLMDSEVINRTIENTSQKGPRHALSRVVFQAPVSAVAATIAQTIGSANTLTLQSACCSGLDAIGHAADAVATGMTDFALCGGAEAPIFYHPMLELKMAGLSPETSDQPSQLSRPFDLWRTTGVIGEGACILVLEPESSPRSGYAFIDGYAYASDASGDVVGGLLFAIQHALANARARPFDVDHISAWGPGHREIDAAEAEIITQAFGSYASEISVVSIKGSIGNPFAAAGAIQVGCTALGMRENFIPPTVNWQYPDPACRLNLSSKIRYVGAHAALINSHGLSGTNSAIVLRAD